MSTQGPIATSTVNNSSPYSFQNPSGSLSSGIWAVSPQPIAQGASDFLAFKAAAAAGLLTGVAGVVTYDVYNNSNAQVGTLTLAFSDPTTGANSCSASTTVAGLTAVPNYDPGGEILAITWTIYDAAQVMMTLAAFAYAEASQISGLLQNSPAPDPPVTPPVYATDSNWALVWGPALSTSSSNQMYVVNNSQTGEYAVAIRGTEPSWTIGGLVQLYEDLDIDTPVAWPYTSSTSNPQIAQGTNVGLNDLLGMQYTNGGNSQTLLEYLTANASTATLYVTGHSLGGCLASVLALYLADELSGAMVVPYTFAAPTAGNQAFADLFSNFSQSYRYYNTLDAIPLAWGNLVGIETLYGSTVPCPSPYQAIIKGVDDLMTKDLGSDTFYVQPGVGTPLTGTICPVHNTGLFAAEKNFDEEIGDQHDHNLYLSLLGAPTLAPPTC